MRKLRLDDLVVESFATGCDDAARGTVKGAEDVTFNVEQTCGETRQAEGNCTYWTCGVAPTQCDYNTCDPCGGGGGSFNWNATCKLTCPVQPV